jgi:dipeptidyl aminopeptidase/acylaminoacyl peptidase
VREVSHRRAAPGATGPLSTGAAAIRTSLRASCAGMTKRRRHAVNRVACASMREVRCALLAVSFALLTAPPASGGVIAFSSDRCPDGGMEGCGASIWTVSDDGSGIQRVTGPSSVDRSFDDQPSWSPDGRSLLYRRDLFARAGRRSLWITRADGAEKRQVGSEVPNDRFASYDVPEWSPDGRWIAFSGRPTGATPWNRPSAAIWMMSADGGEVRQLTDGYAVDTVQAFSPDGRRLAFTRSQSVDGRMDRALLTMDLDGRNAAPVIVGAPPGPTRWFPGMGAFRASWSPAGDRFALAFYDDLYTIRSDGSGLRWVGRTGSPFSQLQWTSEPTPAVIFDKPSEGQPLFRLELTPAALPPTPITPPGEPGPDNYFNGDEDPDWRPSNLVQVLPDLTAPAVIPVDVAARPGAAASRRLDLRRGQLSFLAVDPSGVRSVQVSLARARRARRGHRRCRFLGPRRFSRPRSCSRLRWNRVRSAGDFTRLLRRVRPGRYALRLRGVDGLGNRTVRPREIALRLRR